VQEDIVWRKALDDVTGNLRQEIAESASIAAAGTAALLSELRAIRRALDSAPPSSAASSTPKFQRTLPKLHGSTLSGFRPISHASPKPEAVAASLDSVGHIRSVMEPQKTKQQLLQAPNSGPQHDSPDSTERSYSPSVSWVDVRLASAGNVLVCDMETDQARRSAIGSSHVARRRSSMKAAEGQSARSGGAESVQETQNGGQRKQTGSSSPVGIYSIAPVHGRDRFVHAIDEGIQNDVPSSKDVYSPAASGIKTKIRRKTVNGLDTHARRSLLAGANSTGTSKTVA
jgi:hypothetical protein